MHTTLDQIYQPIDQAIAETRVLVRQFWTEAVALTPASLADTQQAEGKLLRPALCLLAAGALGESALDRYAPLAAAYEVIHIASLAHDDVVDHALLRRGQDSLNARWSNHAAILCGDYLVAHGIDLINGYNSAPLISSALDAVRQMAAGELRFFGHNAVMAPEEDAVALAKSKTGSLFAAACSGPAILINPAQRQVLYEFGIALGIAFQLVDDLLDITQPTSALGKPSCGDIVEGKYTLPVHLMRQAMTEAEQQRLAALRGGTLTEDDYRWIGEVIQNAKIDIKVLDRAGDYIDKGTALLEQLPQSPCRSSMKELAHFVVARHS